MKRNIDEKCDVQRNMHIKYNVRIDNIFVLTRNADSAAMVGTTSARIIVRLLMEIIFLYCRFDGLD